MTEGQTPVEVFCSYAHEDELWLRKLETHLSLLKRQGLISFWHDRLTVPGTGWANTIDSHLEAASVILLLVSADFLASDYCYGVEMKRALEREVAGEARVIPILIRPADWTNAPFAHLQALPTDAKPIASWHNKDTALTDVTAGIRRVIVEELLHLTASAPRAALPAIWNIPYPRNPFFLGRESELLRIRQNLHTGQVTALSQPQAISGLGGIGKTQLALEYAYRYRQDYRVVLWAYGESKEALISSYIALAELLRLSEHGIKEQDIIVRAVKTWLQMNGGWLLILDNADELAIVQSFLPVLSSGHVLLTTRAIATGQLVHRLEIEILSPEQGALLLFRRAKLLASDAELSQACVEERDLALRISQELGGLPLALDQAGAYLEETGIDLSGYWNIYQQHKIELLRMRGGLVANHPEPVATTWSLSFQRVEGKNPAAADLLRACAFLSSDIIPEEILVAGASHLGPMLAPVVTDTFLFNQAIEALRTHSLVYRNPKESSFTIHRLVQAVLRDTQERADQRLWMERVMFAVNLAFPYPDQDTWPQCERLLPHALQVARYVETCHIVGEEAGSLFHKIASYLRDQERHQEAEQIYQRALWIMEQSQGPEHPSVAFLLSNFAFLYRGWGKYAKAESLYQRALRIQELQGKSESPQIASLLTNLANTYRQQGKLIEAEPLYQRALCIWQQQGEPEYLQMASPLFGFANLYTEQGRYAEAESLYQHVLHVREQQLGLEHPHTVSPLDELAHLYFKQGKYEQAEVVYQRILHIREQALEPEHPFVALPLAGLANIYREQGKYEQAEPLYQRVLHIREQKMGAEHPKTARVLHDMAVFQEVRGHRDEAKSLYIRTLAIREQTLGMHHPQTTKTRACLIALLHIMGHHEEVAQLENEGFQPKP